MSGLKQQIRRKPVLGRRNASWLVWTLLCTLAPTSPIVAQTHLKRDIDLVLKGIPHAQTITGVCIVDLASGKTVYSQGADVPIVPASNMKLFTMATALQTLGADFEFETTLATDGHNLVLIGDGDPALGDEKLSRKRNEPQYAVFDRWTAAIKASGQTAYDGDLVIDESIFDGELVHPSWEIDDLGKWYSAPVGGLNINNNCVNITMAPGEKVDDPLQVLVEPTNTLVKIRNFGRTGPGGTPKVYHPWDSMNYRISGRCNKVWPFPAVAFPDPGLLTADAFREHLKERGVTIAGEIKRRRVLTPTRTLPAGLTVLDTYVTKLSEILPRVGKNSQNLFAECLLKRSGKAYATSLGQSDKPGSWALGTQAVHHVLKRAGIAAEGLVVADGSGLSRDNRYTARQATALLAWMHSTPDFGLFRDSLSIAGVDGSLKSRLRDIPNIVRAKTGTMKRIRTLAGYVDGNGKAAYAFAVFFNKYAGSSTPYKHIQDRICRILHAAAATSKNN